MLIMGFGWIWYELLSTPHTALQKERWTCNTMNAQSWGKENCQIWSIVWLKAQWADKDGLEIMYRIDFSFREKLIPNRRDPLIVVHMWSTCSWAPAHRASGNGFKTSCFIYIMIFALYIYRCKNTSASQPWCFFKSRSAQVYLDWCQIPASCQDLEL